MQPVIQATNNPLVVDTGRERSLSTPASVISTQLGSFPRLGANLGRPESARGIDLVVISPGHLDHIGGLVTKSGALAFPKAQFVFVDTEWSYWTGSRFESEVDNSPLPDPFKRARLGRLGEPAAGRRPFPVREAGRRNHQRRALCCCAGTFAVSCVNPVRLRQGAVHAYGRHCP